MINQTKLEYLVSQIKQYGKTNIFYVASDIEMRETYIDELAYKSDPSFKILELTLTGINNAYWEYLRFKEYPELYHTEEEHVWQDNDTKYVLYYTVPNKERQYINEFNPRIPSAIFGKKRILYKNNTVIADYSDPSPIKPIYTNSLSYNALDANAVKQLLDNGDLDWKYKKLDPEVVINNISFKYVTSDWYIFDIDNFPRIEKHMINVNHKTAFFISNYEAQDYLDDFLA